VLERKGLSRKWIEWVMQAVQGGRVAIDLNGENDLSLGVLKILNKVTLCHLSFLIWWLMFYLIV